MTLHHTAHDPSSLLRAIEFRHSLGRSHHYNHSAFNDLIITGLVGLRPRADDVLEVNPLIDPADPKPITWFCLQDVAYHGQNVTIVYDADGKHYNRGSGLSVIVDGRQVLPPSPLGRVTIPIQPPPPMPSEPTPINLAVNLRGTGLPAPSASINDDPANLMPAIDGRIWYWRGIPNYWSSAGSTADTDWYAIDFGRQVPISAAELYFFEDGKQFRAPSAYAIEYWTGTAWAPVSGVTRTPDAPIGNGQNSIQFPVVTTSKLRAIFTHAKPAATALVELRVY